MCRKYVSFTLRDIYALIEHDLPVDLTMKYMLGYYGNTDTIQFTRSINRSSWFGLKKWTERCYMGELLIPPDAQQWLELRWWHWSEDDTVEQAFRITQPNLKHDIIKAISR